MQPSIFFIVGKHFVYLITYWNFVFLLPCVESLAQGWMAFEANEYFYESDINVSYDQAAGICRNYSATLAIITSEDQNDFIAHNLTSNSATVLVIGLKRSTFRGKFEWQDGTPLSYTNWGDSQPDGHGDCVILSGDKWYDFNCQSQKQYVCQRSLVIPTTDQVTTSKATIAVNTTTSINTTTTTAALSAPNDTAIIIFVVTVVLIFLLLLFVGILIYKINRNIKRAHVKKTGSQINSISIGLHPTQPTSLGPKFSHSLLPSRYSTSSVSGNVHTRTSSLIAGYLTLSEIPNSQATSNDGYENYFNSEMTSDFHLYDQIANNTHGNESTQNDMRVNQSRQNLNKRYKQYENFPRPSQKHEYVNVPFV